MTDNNSTGAIILLISSILSAATSQLRNHNHSVHAEPGLEPDHEVPGDGRDKVIILDWMSKKLDFHAGGDQRQLKDPLSGLLLAEVVEVRVIGEHILFGEGKDHVAALAGAAEDAFLRQDGDTGSYIPRGIRQLFIHENISAGV